MTAGSQHTMVDMVTSDYENHKDIQAVESSFGPQGKPLVQSGRFLIRKGRLMKQSRKGQQPKVFFLFNDILVYGSIIINGRWHKKQQIIPLEDVLLEDLQDGVGMKNQWLIRTPKKSFYVSAASYEEKRAWIKHIEECRLRVLQGGTCRSSRDYASSWIPDHATPNCMHCTRKFTVTHRRHHCRKCGFVVCDSCSRNRRMIENIDMTKPVRVCDTCHLYLRTVAPETNRLSWDSDGTLEVYDYDEMDRYSEEEDKAEEEVEEDHDPSRWMDSWSTYVYLKPEHNNPAGPEEN
ncbi:pleckstrin homology domain-containing family F member 2-like [Pholidichthys leucotaenia]